MGFCFHKWGKWSDLFSAMVRMVSYDSCRGEYTAPVTMQKRKCKKCLRVQMCIVIEGTIETKQPRED